jgi:hypothetical membrane protein
MNRQQQLSGTLILIGALQGIFMIAVMEALVAGYSVRQDTISYLGTVAPTAYMFTATLVFAGLCVASGAILSRRFFWSVFYTSAHNRQHRPDKYRDILGSDGDLP